VPDRFSPEPMESYQTACQFGVSPLEEAGGLKFLPPVLSARSFS
jgi:hypothetical protein